MKILESFLLFLHSHICYWYLIEAPHRDTSNEYPNICFLWSNKKTIPVLSPNIFLNKFSDISNLILCRLQNLLGTWV